MNFKKVYFFGNIFQLLAFLFNERKCLWKIFVNTENMRTKEFYAIYYVLYRDIPIQKQHQSKNFPNKKIVIIYASLLYNVKFYVHNALLVFDVFILFHIGIMYTY